VYRFDKIPAVDVAAGNCQHGRDPAIVAVAGIAAVEAAHADASRQGGHLDFVTIPAGRALRSASLRDNHDCIIF